MKVFLLKFFCLQFLLIGLFISCNQNPGKKISQVETNDNEISKQPDAIFYVKDSTQYSSKFLEKLKASGYALKYSLTDSMLIMNNIDTVLFPQYLPLNKNIELSGKSNEDSISLFVRRKSYTTISFEFKIFHSGELTDEQNGEADIGSLFFLGAESDEDDKSGISYLATEYHKNDSSCKLSIRIGSEDNDEIKGKLNRLCSNERKNIDLNKCPTLRTIK